MTLFEYIFDVQTIFDVTVLYSKYAYYTVEPDGRMVLLICNPRMRDKALGSQEDFITFMSVALGVEEDYLACEENKFIDYSKLDFLRSINIEGDISAFEHTILKYQWIEIMGKCGSECSDTIKEGRAMRWLLCSRNGKRWGITLMHMFLDLIIL